MCPDDELTNETIDETPTTTDTSTGSDDNTSTTPTTPSYCNKDDVNSLFGDISDDATDDLFNTAINNSTAWVNANLKRNRIPVPLQEILTESPTEIVIETDGNTGLNITEDSGIEVLKTAAIYYAASDILLSLYHGEELPVQYDVWFQKAQEFLNAYIEAYWNSDADADEQLNHQIVKHSRALTYNQKRRCRRFY